MRTGIPGPEGSASKLALVGGEPAPDEARARDSRGGAGRRRRLLAVPAAAHPRQHDRGGHVARSSATSSPSACSACRGRADGLRVHRGAGGPAARGAHVPRGEPVAVAGAARPSSAGSASSNRSRSSRRPSSSRSSAACSTRGRTSRARRGDDRRRQLAAHALEAVGIGSRAVEMAIDLRSEREQFGKKIGTYQAVSHPLVGHVRRRRAGAGRSPTGRRGASPRSTIRRRTLRAQRRTPRRPRLRSRACETSIQVHGGIGFTFEHPLHRYYKRALELESALGFGRELRAEIAAYLLALVTGASSGIGEACARRLAGRGWEVYASVRRPGDAPDGTRELVFDITDADATTRALFVDRVSRRRRRERRDRDRRSARVPARSGARADNST